MYKKAQASFWTAEEIVSAWTNPFNCTKVETFEFLRIREPY